MHNITSPSGDVRNEEFEPTSGGNLIPTDSSTSQSEHFEPKGSKGLQNIPSGVLFIEQMKECF